MALRFSRQAQKDRHSLTPPLEWLRHLHAADAPVCEPLPTLGGDWIATVLQDSETFLAKAVRWVGGPRLSDLTPTPVLYREYARSIGRLHRVNQGYALSPTAPHMLGSAESSVFPRWDSLWLKAAERVFGFPVLEWAFERLTPDVLTWAEESVMTHGDLRPGNVIWQGTRAVIIDFDEPVLGPAALDLARAALELNSPKRPALLAALLEG
ncbi:Ser/Thr protein kinase RdoA (MazF antagonist) [Deinococcus sp. UYEF24]